MARLSNDPDHSDELGGAYNGDGDGDGDDSGEINVTVVAITDELDLHHFSPREVAGLVRDYLDECVERGFTSVRIIHGKGIGNLRRTVHAQLERHPAVREFRLGGADGGGWGATIVDLHGAGEFSGQNDL